MLKEGDVCWIQYKKGIYKGLIDNKHSVYVKEENGNESIVFIDYEPLPDFINEKIFINRSGQLMKFNGKQYSWLVNGKLSFAFGYNTNKPDSERFIYGDELNDLEEVKEDFASIEEIRNIMDEVYSTNYPLRQKIHEIEKQIEENTKPIIEIRKKCFHEWVKDGEEIETGSGSFLGKSFSQEYICTICDKKDYRSYTKI